MRPAIFGAFLGLAAFGWFVPFELRAAANTDILVKDVTVPGVTDRPSEWHVLKLSDFIPFEIPATANEDLLIKDVTIPGVTDRPPEGGVLKLSDGGVLEFHYDPISDSGVQLRRLNRQGKIIWEHYCEQFAEGLGTRLHSEYYQDVSVFIEGETVRVISQASGDTFVERLNFATGKRISRSVNCNIPSTCIPLHPVRSN